MFEITADDIAALGDTDLRGLVAMLCESEMRRRGKPVSAVTWGGDQNASDGGLDVRVDLPKRTRIQGFVPRAATGFQVKKSDMPARDIAKEMRPKGKIRAVIQDLAKENGAYIIVSSNGSVSDLALQKRREAMATAVKGMKGAGSLVLDFYDRGRVASWVRDNPGLIPWVRRKIGKSIQGWRSYGAWAYAAEDVKASYLLDDRLRVHSGKRESESGVAAADGLNRIRDILRGPQKAIRLVGLSGVGKTRFVQALFDWRVGKQSLDPSIAIYANMADDPDPQPVGLASDLLAWQTRAILVIDNCPPDLHRRLAEVSRTAGSKLSVITVEYDIRDDDPEETEVFRLEPSSAELIEKLVRARFKNISQVDAKTIATFSGGNARVALALAGTIGRNETVAGLTDEELFGRLFRQRHDHDPSLLLIAQVASLVYSFQGEATTGEGAELPVFAAMTGNGVDDVFRAVVALQNRDLVQQRGVWRAVLPHAIANRLAAMALQNIPFETIKAAIIDGGSTRLLRSCSRRLGYLHDNRVAVRIVNEWLAEGGLLGDIPNLSAVEMAVFQNIAPVDPDAVVAAVERAPPESLSGQDALARIIRSIAYDPKLFDRCIELLLRCGVREDENNKGADRDRHLTSLFHIILSGTKAPVEQRLAVLDSLLRSDDAYRRAVGIKALCNVLEAFHFSSGTDFEFGARPRDYGLWPKTGADIKHWYVSAFRLIETIEQSGLPIAAEVSTVLASQIRGLWNQPLIRSELDRLCRVLAKDAFWREGWIGVCQTLKYDSKGMTEEVKAKLIRLEKALKPKNLVQKVRGIVLSTNSHGLDFDDFDYDDDDGELNSINRLNRIAVNLGKDTAHDPGALQELLPEMVGGYGAASWNFGTGLGTSTDDPEPMWRDMVAQLGATPERSRNTQVLRGFLEGLSASNVELVNRLLDEALTHETLAPWFVELQCGVAIDKRAVDRLQRSLTLNKVPMYQYRYLALGRAADPIAGPDLKAMLLAMASKPDGGLESAIEILYMRFFSDKQAKKPLDPALIETGRALIGGLDLTKGRQKTDHRMGCLIKTCLAGPDGATGATMLCEKLKNAVAIREVYAFEQDELLKNLFEVQPDAALEAFFGGGGADQKVGCEIIRDVSHHHLNPLTSVPLDVLVAWCERKPSERYAVVASVIPWSQSQEDRPSQSVWSAAALAVLDKAPDRIAVLKQFVRRFRPMSWSGSRAATMETRLPLLRQLELHVDPAIAAFAKAEGALFKKEIDRERERETQDDKANDERFE